MATFLNSREARNAYNNGIYELILQPIGELTVDWAGKIKLSYKEV